MDGSVFNTGTFCPLLENKESSKLVGKYGETTLFAFSIGIPYTCFEGGVSGAITYLSSGSTDLVSGTALSAQRLFPVPTEQSLDVNFGLAAESVDLSLQAGAAMTALSLTIGGSKVALLVDDHFLATPVTDADGQITGVNDTEDFRIAGSSGAMQISGRLAGRGSLSFAATHD
ncbi:MAG: hypothetical protein WAM94_10975, partial [Chromatiaceae bacterium]